jgi:peptidoglycan/LPS O-acetylase OafA/YrhL
MGFSFLMPFIILIGKINRKYVVWLLLAGFLTSNIVREFFVHFILGVCLTLFFCDIQKESFKNTFLYRYRALIIPVFILLFSLRHISRIHEIGSSLINLMNFVGFTFFLLSGLAAFVFLIYIIRFKKVQAFLMHPILLFYGRISYGIYLGHWILLRVVADYWKSDILPAFPNKETAFIVVLLICFVLSSILAVLLHYFVELPFIKIGKKLVRKMKPTMTV